MAVIRHLEFSKLDILVKMTSVPATVLTSSKFSFKMNHGTDVMRFS